MKQFRPETDDEVIWNSVVDDNKYKLPDSLHGWVVIDIGSHIGAFTYACVMRGAYWVWAYEADGENIKRFNRNTRDFDDRCYVTQGAVYNPVVELGQTRILSLEGSILYGTPNCPVRLISFDDILEQVYSDNFPRRKILVKLNCAGSEWPILFASRQLHFADKIIGQWHSYRLNRRIKGREIYYRDDIIRLFIDIGFKIETESYDDENVTGLFSATR